MREGRLVQFRLKKQSTRGVARSRQRRKRPIELAPRILVFPQIFIGLRERQTESRLEPIVRDARGFLQVQGLLDHARRICILLQAEQALSDDGEELQLRLWIDVGALVQSALRLPEQIGGRQNLAADLCRIGIAKHRGDERRDFFRSRFLGQRHTSLPRRDTGADDDGRKHRSGGRDGDGVTRRELAHAVPETIRAREHRSPVEVAFEVIPERVDGGISLVRFLLQRL